MIEPAKRNAIYQFHQEGMSIRKISRCMHVSRETVMAIIQQEGKTPDTIRRDKVKIDTELLRRLHVECEGYVQRIHEKLMDEEGKEVGYSTLTRMIRELEIGQPENSRCDRVPDKPGDEMQHDTSPYIREIDGKKTKIIASLLYYRYCKQRYLKFYRAFNRFRMKCFLDEALTFYGYAAKTAIIDNTNLARLRGTGKNAVIVPEMEQFAKQYGFKFICHEKGHCNRKAGEERGFYTVETNFFPGRKFESLEDLNRQALEWATVKIVNRPVGKSKIIPAQAFEYEKPYLKKLPPYVQPPYLHHERRVDQYGYIPLDSNFYWVPGTSRADVKILQYSDSISIYQNRKLMAEYKLPADGVRNKDFSPPGEPKSRYKPRHRTRPTELDEKKLRAICGEVDAYLNFIVKTKTGKEKHRFIRELFGLCQRITRSLFIKAIKRALKYRITDIRTIERIAMLQMNDGLYEMPLVETDEEYRKRDAYIEGRLTDEPDLSVYDKIGEDENNG